MAKQDSKSNTGSKSSKSAPAEVWEEGSVAAPEPVAAAPEPTPEPEPAPAEAAPEPVAAAPVAAKKSRKKGQRTPLGQRLSAAPTAARKAIIIEEQLKMVQRRRAGILALVSQDVLDNVDPSLL
jgi:hypothetical protein